MLRIMSTISTNTIRHIDLPCHQYYFCYIRKFTFQRTKKIIDIVLASKHLTAWHLIGVKKKLEISQGEKKEQINSKNKLFKKSQSVFAKLKDHWIPYYILVYIARDMRVWTVWITCIWIVHTTHLRMTDNGFRADKMIAHMSRVLSSVYGKCA